MAIFVLEINLAKSISVVSLAPVFIGAVYGGIVFQHLKKRLKLFSLFLFFSAIMQLISGIMWWNKINNLPLLHVYVAGGFVCIALFYRELFRHLLDHRILLCVAIAFVVFAILNALFFQSLFQFSSRTLTVESILVIVISLSTFTLFMNDYGSDIELPDRKSLSWINAGFFIYFSSNLLIFYFGDIFTRKFSVYLNQNTWMLHSFFSMIMYSCFIVALWKRPRSLTS